MVMVKEEKGGLFWVGYVGLPVVFTTSGGPCSARAQLERSALSQPETGA